MTNKRQGLVFVTLFSLAWAIQTILIKVAVDRDVEPLSFLYQALFGSASILLIYILLFKKNTFHKFRKSALPQLVAIGAIGSGAGSLLTFYGLKYSTSINFGFIIKSTVVFSVFFAWLFLKEKMSLKKLFYVMILLFGAYLISTNGELINPKIGDLIILAAAFCMASANVLAKPVLKTQSAEVVTFFRTFFGGLIVLLSVAFIIPHPYRVSEIYLLIGVSFFNFLSLLFLNKTIETTSISYMTMMSMMYSVFVVILSWLLFGDTISAAQACGGLLIMVSAIMIQKSADGSAVLT